MSQENESKTPEIDLNALESQMRTLEEVQAGLYAKHRRACSVTFWIAVILPIIVFAYFTVIYSWLAPYASAKQLGPILVTKINEYGPQLIEEVGKQARERGPEHVDQVLDLAESYLSEGREIAEIQIVNAIGRFTREISRDLKRELAELLAENKDNIRKAIREASDPVAFKPIKDAMRNHLKTLANIHLRGTNARAARDAMEAAHKYLKRLVERQKNGVLTDEEKYEVYFIVLLKHLLFTKVKKAQAELSI